jgi:hypothetical protein
LFSVQGTRIPAPAKAVEDALEIEPDAPREVSHEEPF